MANLFAYAFMSNIPRAARSLVAESLILQVAQTQGRKSMAVNLDRDIVLSCRVGKATREDPVSRYGKALGQAEVPVLAREDFKDFLQDAARSRNQQLLEDRSLLVFLDKAPVKETFPILDSICFFVSADHSSIPYIYAAMKAQHESGQFIPVKVLIVGEQRIEIAAEFFMSIKKELRELRKDDLDIAFAGAVSFDQDELDLASGFDIPFIEAYPGGSIHGQVKYAVNKIFTRDAARSSVDDAKKLELLGLIA